MINSLDEAIKHCEEVAEDRDETANLTPTEYEDYINSCRECAEEHRQMAEWLRELKAYRNIRRILSQNRVVTEMGRDRHGRDIYGEVVMWDDIKRAFEEVNVDD